MTDETPTSVTIVRRMAPDPQPDGTMGAPAPKVIGVAGVDGPQPTMVKTYPWYVMVLIRVARAYVVSFSGLLSLAFTGTIAFNVGDQNVGVAVLGAWSLIGRCALAATVPSFVSLAMNAAEFLTNVDMKHPLVRA